MVALACASCACRSSPDLGTAFTTVVAAELTVDCADAAALLADSAIVGALLLECESGGIEPVLRVTASACGEPYDGDGEP